MAKDPYLYFRVEARELLEGMTRGVLEFSNGITTRENVAGVLRLAHTLKGAARVVKQPAIAEAAHSLESVLEPYRSGATSIPAEQSARINALLEEIAQKISAIDAPPAERPREKPPDAAPSPPLRAPVEKSNAPILPTPLAAPVFDELLQTVRVEIQDLDTLLERVGQLNVHLTGLKTELRAIGGARVLAEALANQLSAQPRGGLSSGRADNLMLASADELRGSLQASDRRMSAAFQQAQAEMEQLGELANHIRLLPISLLFDSIDRAARDTARKLGKQMQLHVSGGDQGLDAHVLMALRDALLHVVTNAVAHGIETPAERLKHAKPAAGQIEIHAQREGPNLAIVCRDDGRGVDTEGVRSAALKRGIVSAADARNMSRAALIQLLLKGGVSTAESITEVSGRGVGMDVLRETVEKLKGSVKLESEPGRGTSVEIRVPVSLSSLSALLVECNGATLAVPMQSVRKTIRIKASELIHSNDGSSVLVDGRAIPFLPLDAVLGQSHRNGRRSAWSALVVESKNQSAVIGVDRLAGAANIVSRLLPPNAPAHAVVAGASLDTDGNPRLVLDPAGIVAAVRGGAVRIEEKCAAPRQPILIVDDSLTTRMLEQSILESAGYVVELAASAEEALAKVRDQQYGLFLVDVEMPGMNGFEFMEKKNADSNLRDIPGILVTSRCSPEDLLRGKDCGAKAYIVKGDFDQGFLLKTIRALIG